MKLLEKILLATDFSKSSDDVVNYAISLAKTFQSKITLIHVLPDDIKNKKAVSLLNEAAIKMLQTLGERITKEGVSVEEPVLESGSPYEKVVKTANKINANMILIGSGEKAKNDAFRLGVTAEKVIQLSDQPVWVVKKDSPLNVKNILCPVDFSRTSKRALKNAVTIARRFKAKLTILSVYTLHSPLTLRLKIDLEKENEGMRAEHEEKLKKFLKDINLTDLDCAQEVRGGDAAQEILHASAKNKSDILIMGTTGKTGLNRMIVGSVTEKVVREVPCSFITLKSLDLINLKLDSKIKDIEGHFSTANQLMKDGFFAESISEFKNCLDINNMHIPSINGLSKVYEKMNDKVNAKRYKDMGKEILDRIWDQKIESEIRRFYKF